MGSFTFCLVRTAPINATIIINHQGSVLRAATPGCLDGVGRASSAREHHPHSFIKPASSSLWRLLEQSRGSLEDVIFLWSFRTVPLGDEDGGDLFHCGAGWTGRKRSHLQNHWLGPWHHSPAPLLQEVSVFPASGHLHKLSPMPPKPFPPVLISSLFFCLWHSLYYKLYLTAIFYNLISVSSFHKNA